MLIKFSEEVYIDRLLKLGEVYINPLNNYITSEIDGISDKYEKTTRIFGSILFKPTNSTEWTKHKPVGPIIITNNGPLGNAYCAYCENVDLTKNLEHNVTIDSRMYNNGKFGCVIYKPKEFIERLEKACKAQNYEFDYCPVTYKNDSDNKKAPLEKDIRFQYQKEFRFFILNNRDSNPIKLSIGPISDIAFKVDFNKERIWVKREDEFVIIEPKEINNT